MPQKFASGVIASLLFLILTDAQAGISVQPMTPLRTNTLLDEHVGVQPQTGVLVYGDMAAGRTSSQLLSGVTFDFDALALLEPTLEDLYAGFATGLLYSRINSQGIGSNYFIIPANLKLGINLESNSRFSFRFGFNIVSRPEDSGVFPNLGFDYELGLAKGVALLVRPDLTLVAGNSIFATTLGLSITLS